MFPLSSRRSRGKMNINTTLQKPLDLSKKSINEIKEATPIEKHSGIQIIVDSKETNLLKKDKFFFSDDDKEKDNYFRDYVQNKETDEIKFNKNKRIEEEKKYKLWIKSQE